MRILMSGASGLLGSAIRAALEARGDEVRALVRSGPGSDGDVAWDPTGDHIDEKALAAGSFDAVVHLAGESLQGRWDDDKRAQILDSRVKGTGLLTRALAGLQPRPATLLAASAIGYYGSRGDELLTEDSAKGTGFLADVVAAWEDAADPAREAGMRVVHLRMAPVQSAAGGALKEQLLPFRLGLGGSIGGGQQWWPWIGLHDTVRVWLHALDHAEVEGPLNVVGPTPARNAEYAKALGRALRRPTILPTPVPAVKLMFGSQMVEEMLLGSQKAIPARLEALGFEFDDRTIQQAFERELRG
jgi:uncharacterized protein